MIFFRRCIRIAALDSPNVRAGVAERAAGARPTGATVLPGVLSWIEYLGRLATFNPQERCESLEARWYEGPELKLVPRAWLDAAVAYAKKRPTPGPHLPRWMGVDPAEGGDDTCWVIVDRYGVLDLVSLKTPDTSVVFGKTLDLMRRHNVAGENVAFDRGGGKEHADRLRAAGHPVRTYDFGTIKQEPKRGIRIFPEKREVVETKGEFKSRRSEMYWNVHVLLEVPLTADEATDPAVADAIRQLPALSLRRRDQFALPLPLCAELVRQLEVVPLTYDDLGKFALIPKQNPNDPDDPNTFRALLGRSPDQADALALAVYCKDNRPMRQTAGPT